jgi:hypothetical protein
VRIPCPQCGGEVPLRDAEGFPTCPFCGAGLVLDRSGVRVHFLYRPRIAADRVLPLLRRWADRHILRAPGDAGSFPLAYYPFWRYAREGPRGLVPAWSTLDPVWDRFRLPDAEQLFFDSTQAAGAEVIEPTVPEAAARVRVLGEGAGEKGDLVHLPVYRATVRVGGAEATLWVDACSGSVLAPEHALPAVGSGSAAGRLAWVAGGGVTMVLVAMVIPSLALAAGAVAVLSLAVYVGLSGVRREGGA